MGWMKRIRSIARGRQIERELDDELQHHIELKTQENIDSGMSPEEARYAALRAFGGVEQKKELCRDADPLRWLEDLIQDLRYGLRQLRRNPGFTAVAVITLALGIGATTAIFSVVDGVLLKPLPYPRADRLVDVEETAPGLHLSHLRMGAAFYFIYREGSRTFEDVGLYRDDSVTVTGLGAPEHLAAVFVTDGVLPILGVRPLVGRWFTRADDQPGSLDTVVLTYGYWERKFGGSRSVIGKTLDIDGKPYSIIGVLPKRFQFLSDENLAMLLPLPLDRAKTYFGYFSFNGIARLKPGVTIAGADLDVARMIPLALRSFPPPPGYSLDDFKQARLGPSVRPLKEGVVGSVNDTLWVLMGGIGLVLLIACANVANLVLVRVEGQRQELAIRSALGATRTRIAGGLLLESLVLALMGGAVGLALAYGGLRILVALAPTGLPRLNEIGIDSPVLLFTFGVTMVAGLLFGFIPALKYAGVGLGVGLRETGRSYSASRERHRARNALVIVQVGLAFVLLISSGLMVRTFRALIHVSPGFSEPAQVQTFRTFIPDTAVKAPEQVVRMQRAILEKVGALPGVSSVGIGRAVPMDGNHLTDPVYVKDRTPLGQMPPLRRELFVSPGFFNTIGTPFVAGRDFTWNDTLDKRPVAIISENFARQYWQHPADALGQQIRITTKDEYRQIVGVVGNVYYDGTNKKAPAMVYWPLVDARFEGGPGPTHVTRLVAFAVRSPLAGSQSLVKEIRRAVWSVDPDLPLFEVHTLDYYYAKSMAGTSFTLVMLAIAGGMALLLGAVGLYGVIAYSVSQRTHEIGIRMALGAQKEHVLKIVLRQGLKLALIGVGIGIAAAVVLTRYLSSLLYGVKPTDPLTFVAVSLTLTAAALVACYIPARRATKVDPIVALRHE
jgi:predicted permease